MKTRSLSPGTFATTIHRGVFAFLIALLAAPGVGRADHGIHTVSYSNGIDAPVVIADEGPGDDNPLEHEIEGQRVVFKDLVDRLSFACGDVSQGLEQPRANQRVDRR